MASLELRDRDGIVTPEGLIFRVFGYTHPLEGFICDAEYAPSELFQSKNPKAFRSDGERVFYKFYEDEGWKFIQKKYPQHMIIHKPLGKKVVGVRHNSIAEVRKPEETLRRFVESGPKDALIQALRRVLKVTVEEQGLSISDFGVFGSLLHGFYNPKFSDIDIVVYGRSNVEKIRSILKELYMERKSCFRNEFADDTPVVGKPWRFKNINQEDFVWHQKRKLIYAVFNDDLSGRTIKVEFEPVKTWAEIKNEYLEIKRIVWKGWVKAILRVIDDADGPFMPSIYLVEPIEVINGPKCNDIVRIVSYLEEFRLQCWRDEIVYVEGNLEEIETKSGLFHQVTLTYGPRYYEQALKVVKPTSAS
ncbi:MAG: nucleotidyltransferase domain-containing protein [Candidatus Bathyarchaeota archaeon]|nr:nucleotidyltransferase domain-containing protein [Candidatus Bathyarchaeota archaeon]MCX8176846.1 nucleotidyltransferase domain-containing protein [Candidatus Bathyarchaeota archaeon]MDW8193470.1 nucleotidyltransferase domain-containing protein [Nitrososphaerota archaeon]